MRKNKGFTLIELVMVIVILGILAAVAMPKYVNLKQDALRASAKATINSVRSAISISYARRVLRGETPQFPPVSSLTATDSSSLFVERQMPTSPIDNANTVNTTTATPVDCTTVDGTSSYLYNESTGEIRYNNSDSDGAGKQWCEY